VDALRHSQTINQSILVDADADGVVCCVDLKKTPLQRPGTRIEYVL
jgi:hypothetical protein